MLEEQHRTPRRIVEQAVEIAQVPQGFQVGSHRSFDRIRAWCSSKPAVIRSTPAGAGPGHTVQRLELPMSPWRRRLRVLVPCGLWPPRSRPRRPAQQPPPIGIAPVTLTAGPYVFDTAEQHKIAVSVVARGLAHPFSLAFLPDGDALVTERGGRLRRGAQRHRRARADAGARRGAGRGRARDARRSGPAACRKWRCTRSSRRTAGCTSPTTRPATRCRRRRAPASRPSRWPAAPSTARR